MKINFDQVPAYIKREITVGEAGLFKGKKGKQVQRVQEWLAVHGFHTVIDGDYGPATNSAVRSFQKVKGLDDTGAVDQATWSLLCKPTASALRAPSKRPLSINALVEFFARRHLKQNPKEIGGSNRGPSSTLAPVYQLINTSKLYTGNTSKTVAWTVLRGG